MSARIRKGDTVIVLAGKDKGRKGQVLRVLPKRGRALVGGVNQIRRHNKASARGPGGIETVEAPIHLSNIALPDPEDGKPSRVGFRIQDGRKLRYAKRSGKLIDG